jgi:hypothetical protein
METKRTNDEMILLLFQRAKIRYETAFSDEDGELEHEYHQARLAFDGFDDPVLKALGKEATGNPGKRGIEAEDELLALSRRVKDLYPQLSQIN